MSQETSVILGFILTRQWFDTDDGIVLQYWVHSAQGIFKISVPNQQAVCFVATDDLPAVKAVLREAVGWHSKPLSLQNFAYQPITALYFSQQKYLYRARNLLQDAYITLHEADIRPPDRFLMERFVTGSVALQLPQALLAQHNIQPINNSSVLNANENSQRRIAQEIPSSSLVNRSAFDINSNQRQETIEVTPEVNKPAFISLRDTRTIGWKGSEYRPIFRVCSLDIETSMDAAQLYSIAVYFGDTGQTGEGIVFMRSEAAQVVLDTDAQPAIFIRCYESTTALLAAFIEWFTEFDPDVVIGWSVVNFDFRCLQQLSERFHVPLTLGRGKQLLHWRQSRENDDFYTMTMPGRLVLDGIETLKSATYQFERFSLDYVSNELLNRGKAIDDVDNRGSEITQMFLHQKYKLAVYNLEDCRLVWDIFEQEHLYDFVIERSRLTGLAADRFGGSVAAFDFRYLPLLHRRGFVAPQLPDNPIGVGSPGGFVMESLPGLYKDVFVLDFKSLYPSIIRSFLIDPLGLAEGEKQFPRELERDHQETENIDRDHFVPGFNGASFSKDRPILPQLVKELWEARDHAKQRGAKPMSQAIKIIMNSFYGVLGTPGCRFFDSRLPSSITCRGQEVLNASKDFIEAKGFRVIYGDTDSVFVVVDSDSESARLNTAEYEQIGKQLTDELNTWFKKSLQKDYGLESYLEVEFETHYQQFFMPTIRGSEKGSKKRYAGLIHRADGNEIVVKGLESVRTDWTKLARNFQNQLLEKIFANQPVDEFILHTVNAVMAGEYDKQLVYRKRIRRKLADYTKQEPPQVCAARKEDRLRKQQGLKPLYERGGWVSYIMTTNGPEPAPYRQSPIDYQRYIDKQLKPVADALLQFIHKDFDEICDQQLSLF